jgi:hypothetical protein
VVIHADHSSICKFNAIDDGACELVIETIAEETKRALGSPSTLKLESLYDGQSIDDFASVSEDEIFREYALVRATTCQHALQGPQGPFAKNRVCHNDEYKFSTAKAIRYNRHGRPRQE